MTSARCEKIIARTAERCKNQASHTEFSAGAAPIIRCSAHADPDWDEAAQERWLSKLEAAIAPEDAETQPAKE